MDGRSLIGGELPSHPTPHTHTHTHTHTAWVSHLQQWLLGSHRQSQQVYFSAGWSDRFCPYLLDCGLFLIEISVPVQQARGWAGPMTRGKTSIEEPHFARSYCGWWCQQWHELCSLKDAKCLPSARKEGVRSYKAKSFLSRSFSSVQRQYLGFLSY